MDQKETDTDDKRVLLGGLSPHHGFLRCFGPRRCAAIAADPFEKPRAIRKRTITRLAQDVMINLTHVGDHRSGGLRRIESDLAVFGDR